MSLWTPDRVDTLRRLWHDGASFAQIANELNCGLTRNACIGKATRLGLRQYGASDLRKSNVRTAAPRARSKDGNHTHRALRILRAKPSDVAIIELAKPHNFLGLTLTQLEPSQCRFPQGESPILFCGNPTESGSWCAHCRKIVFSKVIYSDQERRDHGRAIRAAQRAKRRADQARAA